MRCRPVPVPRNDDAEATDWTLELIVLVAPAPPPLRLRLLVPWAMEIAAAMLNTSMIEVSEAKKSRLEKMPSRLIPLPVVSNWMSPRSAPA